METSTAPFMLIFRDSKPENYSAMSSQQRQQLLNNWNAWYDGLVQQGKAQGGNPLEPSGRVVSGDRGERLVDGPFAEAKEAIAGYFLLTVSGLDEATEIAQRCPNLRHGMIVEVRPVAGACHLAKSLGQQTMKA
ncbi:MAG: YciI family protein [Nibricoccus sp.]